MSGGNGIGRGGSHAGRPALRCRVKGNDARAGGSVCGPVVSMLGVGAGGVMMGTAFALVNAMLVTLAGDLPALAARARR